MNVITDVCKELFSMFVGDARLTIAILALVAAVAFSIKEVASPDPVLSGFALLAGCLAIITTITSLHARRVRHSKVSPK